MRLLRFVVGSALSLLLATHLANAAKPTCASGTESISVHKSDRDFCVEGPICVGESSLGKCPGPQDGLTFGSYCAKLESGPFGCRPLTLLPPQTLNVEDAQFEAAEAPNCTILSDLVPVSVRGIGTLCARGPVCAGSVSGNCPATLTSLEQTYRCEMASDGVYGCVE